MCSKDIALIAVALGGLATAAAAGTCTDTLYLQSFTRYQKTCHIKKNGIVDSTKDSVSVVSTAGRLDPSLILPISRPVGFDADTVLAPLAFAANCGSDSISNVRFWRGIDAPGAGNYGVETRVTSGGEITLQEVVRQLGSTNYSNPDGSIVQFLSYYPISPKRGASAYDIGVLDTSVGALGGIVGSQAVLYKGNFAVNMQYYSMLGTLPTSGITYAMSYQKAAFLKYADSVTHGSYDSLRLTSVAYATLYKKTALTYEASNPTGISARASAASPSFALLRTVEGWRLTTATAATGFVRDSQGRLLRTFPAATSFDWDGHAQNGRPAARGIYLVGFEGQGARILALP